MHVPYKGAGPAVTDLISGQIPIATPNVTAQILELHHAGKLRILAVTSPRRLAGAPDIPTAVEQGLPGYDRAELHRPVRAGAHVARDHRAGGAGHARGHGRRGIPAQLDGVGVRARARVTPDKTRRFVADEVARWAPVIKAIGLKLD